MKHLAFLSVALLAFSLVLSAPPSDAAGYEEYVSGDGSVYEYTTYGNGNASSPFYSVINGFEIGNISDVRILSALEGYQLTEIGDNAFANCNITSVTIPERVTSIGDGAFSGCSSLTDVYFLGDVPEMGTDPFPEGTTFHYLEDKSGWSSYTDHQKEAIPRQNVVLDDGSITDCILVGYGVIVLTGTPNEDGEVTIPNTVSFDSTDYKTFLGAWAFYDRSDVKKVIISEGITDIPERAFYKCASLEYVDIPDSVTVIMDEAFRECHLLNNVTMTKTEFIGFEAFRMCYAMTSITVPDSVTFIGEGAFRYCTIAETIVISKNIDRIEPWLLDGCYALKAFEIPEKVTFIGDHAFHLCRTITEITIPEKVTYIGNHVFDGCSSLSNAYFVGGIPEMGNYVFSGVASDFERHIIESEKNDNNNFVLIVIVAAAIVLLCVGVYIIHSRRTR